MIIGIDGNEANQKARVGVGQFALEVINHLYQLDKKNRYRIYLKEPPLPDLPPERENWQYRVFGPQFAWTQWRLPLKLWLEKPKVNVFFSPNHYAPRFCPVPSVISIMDLWHHYHPEQFRPRDIYQLKKWEAYSVKQAKKIIAISEFTKREIIKFYKVPKDRITVAYPGINKLKVKSDPFGKAQAFGSEAAQARRGHPERSRMDEKLKVKEKYGIGGNYILYLGTLQPKKNLIRLIDALNISISQYPNIFLVIAGKKGWLYEEIFERVKKVKMEKRVIFTGFVPTKDKEDLIAGARCFVLPSLYEGFGIPVLEAMALGVPVAISRVASLPEVGGKAAFYFNPKKPESIAETLLEVLKLSPTERKKVIEKGKKQAQKFTWEKCVRRILEVLEEVGGENFTSQESRSLPRHLRGG